MGSSTFPARVIAEPNPFTNRLLEVLDICQCATARTIVKDRLVEIWRCTYCAECPVNVLQQWSFQQNSPNLTDKFVFRPHRRHCFFSSTEFTGADPRNEMSGDSRSSSKDSLKIHLEMKRRLVVGRH